MRERLRERATVNYQVARSNASWFEHRVRTLTTAGLIAFLGPTSILDVACGDGSLVRASHRLHHSTRLDFADISQPSIDILTKTLTEELPADVTWRAYVEDAGTLLDKARNEGSHWDLILMCEFLEHVENPDWLLWAARQVGTNLIVSSPLIEPPRHDQNEEHLWAFDNDGYMDMLRQANWNPRICQNLMLHDGYYNFQIWACD